MFRYNAGNDIELGLFDDRHTEALFALTDQNRAYLRPWLPWVDTTLTRDDTRAFIQGGLYQNAANNGFQAGVWFKGELAGAIGFLYFNWQHRKTEIGYWLGESFQGGGVMTSACAALIDYAFLERGLNRVEIHCAVGNIKSRAIPQRLGFTEEGIVRQAEWLHDYFADHVLYGLLASEWPASGAGTKTGLT
jgi:ribosomal-protein-serine acetyltransferase